MYLLPPVFLIISLASAIPTLVFYRPLGLPSLGTTIKEIKNQHGDTIYISTGSSYSTNSTRASLEARKAPPKADPSRGCGTAIDNVRKEETLIGDGECHYLLSDIDRMHVGEGCDCVTFESSKCGASEPKDWSSWIRGPSTDGKLPTWGTHWYACSDDRAFGKVCIASLIGAMEIILTTV
jgi:hypothetical protein